MTAHGLGYIPSPPDPADFPISDLYAAHAIEPAVVFPDTYVIPGELPAVLDQDDLPQCVAYGSKAIKLYQDRIDQFNWFPFSTTRFFAAIGGTDQGAVPRQAFDRMLKEGYPLTDGSDAARHRIAAYFAVPLDLDSLRAAVLAFGAVGVGMDWYSSFSRPVAGVLPAPDRRVGGHFIVLIGWRTVSGRLQLRLRNSWGLSWGDHGDCWLPVEHLSVIGEAWKAVDQIVPAPPEVDVRLLPLPVRIFDGAISAKTGKAIQVAGVYGIPAAAVGVVAVIRAVKPTVAGWVYVGPESAPTISTLDFNAGQTNDGFPVVALSAGKLVIYSTQFLSRFVVDVTGYLIGG